MDSNLPVETAFTLFDILAIVTVVASVAVSAMRGIKAELITFGGWILSLIIARVSCEALANSFFPTLQPREMAVVFSFVLMFVAIRIVLHLIDYALDYFITAAQLNRINRILGGIVGLLKGFLFVSLSVLICSFTSLPQKEGWQIAKTSRFFERVAKFIAPALPDFLVQQVVYPPRVGDEDYVPPEEQSTPSGSLKKQKPEKKVKKSPQSEQSGSENSENSNLPNGTSVME